MKKLIVSTEVEKLNIRGYQPSQLQCVGVRATPKKRGWLDFLLRRPKKWQVEFTFEVK